MSAIKARIQEDVKDAMRAQAKERLVTIRLITAALKQREVDERITLTDEQVLQILDKMVKQRRESITQFTAGNRPELAAKEQAEIDIIQAYMPTQLGEAEVEALIAAAVKTSGAASMRDMGKVMEIVRPQVQGRADMTLVSNIVKKHLTK